MGAREECREAERLGRALTEDELRAVRRRETGRLDRALDEGHGKCHLRHSGAAEIVAAILRRGTGYRLHAYAVMPNHVHALVHAEPEINVTDVIRAWKSVSSRELTAHLGIVAPVWQRESFDHLVRDQFMAERFRHYILDNPVKAGLSDWPHVGAFDHGYEDVVWPRWL